MIIRGNDGTKDELRWAVVGHQKKDFTDEFISEHPMDFYEEKEQIEGEYDIYLMKEHDNNSLLEFRDVRKREFGGDMSFKSSLSFFGKTENYEQDGNVCLRHLRMVMGGEVLMLNPLDFSDFYSFFGNKKIRVDAASFSEDPSLATLLKWVREVDKKHSLKNHTGIILCEGISLSTIMELVQEIPESFESQISSLSFFDTMSKKKNVSIWWYEDIDVVKNIRKQWECYCDNKMQYLSGDKTIDMKDYCELVRRTWRYIKNINSDIDESLKEKSPDVKINKSFLLCFHEYIKMSKYIEQYSVFAQKDQSKDYIFTVTAMLADELARLIVGKTLGTPQYNFQGEYTGFGGCYMDVTLAASYPNNKERILYDVEEKDYSVLLEAAKRINKD